jgi:hypothetical protein
MLALPERSLEISYPPDCLRQLIFESDWEEFPYWMMETGFLALWNNSIFLITLFAIGFPRAAEASKVGALVSRWRWA